MPRIASPVMMIALAAGLAVGLAGGVAAHSLEDLEKELNEREFYAEIVERPAPDFTLQTAEGEEVSLSDFSGKVVVLWFIFAGCTDVCPLQSQAIADIQADINQTPMRDLVQFVAITTDPERDTAEVMAAYGPAQGLDPENWVFLTSGTDGPEDATRAIAWKYGLRFTPTGDGQQLHGVVTHLIDRAGVMRARYHGLKFNPTNMIVHINALTHDDHPDVSSETSFWKSVRSLLPW
jgi:protein SCO1